MSECLHLHDNEGHDIGYVCVPGPFKYVPRAHVRGAHTYKVLSEPLDSLAEAFDLVRDALLSDRRFGAYNRADILADEGPESYYDPYQILEVRVR